MFSIFFLSAYGYPAIRQTIMKLKVTRSYIVPQSKLSAYFLRTYSLHMTGNAGFFSLCLMQQNRGLSVVANKFCPFVYKVALSFNKSLNKGIVS